MITYEKNTHIYPHAPQQAASFLGSRVSPLELRQLVPTDIQTSGSSYDGECRWRGKRKLRSLYVKSVTFVQVVLSNIIGPIANCNAIHVFIYISIHILILICSYVKATLTLWKPRRNRSVDERHPVYKNINM